MCLTTANVSEPWYHQDTLWKRGNPVLKSFKYCQKALKNISSLSQRQGKVGMQGRANFFKQAFHRVFNFFYKGFQSFFIQNLRNVAFQHNCQALSLGVEKKKKIWFHFINMN